MVNKREKTIITDMKWSSDGQHICIIYNDGVVILGSLEGNRVWVKELKNTALTNIEWSPDKRLLLFGIASGEVHLYDFNSNYLDKIVIQCPDVVNVRIAAIDWYDGQNGFVSPDSPALAICYSNGKCQIMTNETDESKNLKHFFFISFFFLCFPFFEITFLILRCSCPFSFLFKFRFSFFAFFKITFPIHGS